MHKAGRYCGVFGVFFLQVQFLAVNEPAAACQMILCTKTWKERLTRNYALHEKIENSFSYDLRDEKKNK